VTRGRLCRGNLRRRFCIPSRAQFARASEKSEPKVGRRYKIVIEIFVVVSFTWGGAGRVGVAVVRVAATHVLCERREVRTQLAGEAPEAQHAEELVPPAAQAQVSRAGLPDHGVAGRRIRHERVRDARRQRRR